MKWNFYQPGKIYINQTIRNIANDLYRLIWDYSLSDRPFEKDFSRDISSLAMSGYTLTLKQYHTLIRMYEACQRKWIMSKSSATHGKFLKSDSEVTRDQLGIVTHEIGDLKNSYRFSKPLVSRNSSFIAVGCHTWFYGDDGGDCNEIFLYDVKSTFNRSYRTVSGIFTSFFCFSPDEEYFAYIDENLLPGGPCETRLIQINIVYLKSMQVLKIFPDATVSDRRRWYFQFSNTGRYLAVLTWKNGIQIYDAWDYFSLMFEAEGHGYNIGELKWTFPEEDSTPINKYIHRLVFSDDDNSFRTYAGKDEEKVWVISSI